MWKPIIAVVLALTSVTVSPASASPSSSLSWQDCGDGLQCARLAVPADWARPGHAEVGLGLAKLAARDPAAKQGTLLVNLGGPGEQILPLRYLKTQLADLTEWFDVVVSDPRGFGQSGGITCPVRSPQEAEYVFGTEERYDRYRETNHEFGVRCTEAAGPLAGNLDSWQVARDMDAIRKALGERRLNYSIGVDRSWSPLSSSTGTSGSCPAGEEGLIAPHVEQFVEEMLFYELLAGSRNQSGTLTHQLVRSPRWQIATEGTSFGFCHLPE